MHHPCREYNTHLHYNTNIKRGLYSRPKIYGSPWSLRRQLVYPVYVPWYSQLIVPEKLVDALIGRLAAVVAAAVDEACSPHSVHHTVGVLQRQQRKKQESGNNETTREKTRQLFSKKSHAEANAALL